MLYLTVCVLLHPLLRVTRCAQNDSYELEPKNDMRDECACRFLRMLEPSIEAPLLIG